MKENKLCPLCKSDRYFILNKIETYKIIKNYSSNIKVKHFFEDLKAIKKLECECCGIVFFDHIVE
ncbi:MAG: hypothetical protein WCG25_01950 [bacterium]